MIALFISMLFSFTLLAQDNAPSSIGYYSNGRLENAAELPHEGTGFMRLFIEHDRGYGTWDMINMIIKSGQDMNTLFPNLGRLQIEDISARHGGQITRHGSHQNGLDADITYFRKDGREHVPFEFGTEYGVPMVENGSISPLFDSERTWALLKSLHRHGRVQRIFMDNVIKSELCRFAREKNDFDVEILRSIRHEDNHQDHMHVRIRCPQKDKACVAQTEVPPGPGCPGSGSPLESNFIGEGSQGESELIAAPESVSSIHSSN